MAQIVTITNPLTGQPAQVDQLDHTAQEIDDAIARALPGGAIDTALQNKPSKSPVHVDDANDVTKSGFYTCKTNIPFGYGPANVLAVGDIDDPNNIFTQIAFGVNLNPVNRNAIAVRCYVPGEGFKDWEWFNPPMTIGVEYRTTERYLGKPVYVKIVDIGACPNTSTKAVGHGIANIDQCISAIGILTAPSGDTFSIPYASMSDGMTNDCSFSRTEVRVWSAGDDSANSAKVLIKYTKTTD